MEQLGSPLAILKALWNGRWKILVPASLLFFAAVIYAVALRDAYQSTSILMSKQAQPSERLINSSIRANANQMLRDARERIMDADALESVITRMDLYRNTRAKGGMPAAVTAMRSDLQVLVDPQVGTIKISYKALGGPEAADLAADIVNEVTALYLQSVENAIKGQAVDVAKFLVEGENEFLDALRAAERELAEFKRVHRDALPTRRATNEAAINQAESRIEILADRMQRDAGEIERLKLQVMQTKQQVEEARSKPGGDSALLSSLRASLTELETTGARLRGSYHEGNAKIKENERQIQEVRARMEKEEERLRKIHGENSTLQILQLYLSSTEKRIETLTENVKSCEARIATAQKEIETAQANITRSHELEDDYRALLQKVDDAQRRRNNVLNKSEMAEFTVDWQQFDPSLPFTVESRAVPAIEPIGPNRLAISAVGLVAGIALGVGFIILRMRMDRSLHNSNDLRPLLPGTIVVCVPDVISGAQRAGRSIGQLFLTVAVAAVFAAAVTVLGCRIEWWGSKEMLEPLLRHIPIS